MEPVRACQRDNAKRGGKEVSREYKPVVGRVAARLPRHRSRRQSLHRKQKPSRYRRFVRYVSRQYLPRCANVAFCYIEGASKELGCRNRIRERFFLRVQRV